MVYHWAMQNWISRSWSRSTRQWRGARGPAPSWLRTVELRLRGRLYSAAGKSPAQPLRRASRTPPGEAGRLVGRHGPYRDGGANAQAMDHAELDKFAKSYAEAWCSQNPESVAAFYAEGGSLRVNDGPPAVGREAIAEVAQAIHARSSGHEGHDGCGEPRRARDSIPLDAHRIQYRPGRHGKTCSNQRLRRVAA